MKACKEYMKKHSPWFGTLGMIDERIPNKFFEQGWCKAFEAIQKQMDESKTIDDSELRIFVEELRTFIDEELNEWNSQQDI